MTFQCRDVPPVMDQKQDISERTSTWKEMSGMRYRNSPQTLTSELSEAIRGWACTRDKHHMLNNFVFIFSVPFFILQFINYVVLVSGVQQSDSLIHINASILCQICFPFKLSQSTEQRSLCYIQCPCCLSILNIAVCTCQSQTPNLSLPATLPSW